MGKFEKAFNDITQGNSTPEIDPNNLPIGYMIRKEPKTRRRSFAMQSSVVDALETIAAEKGINVNALVNEILIDYVNEYNGKG